MHDMSPPPLIEACAALLLSAALALPATAQGVPGAAVRNSRVLESAPATVYALTTNLVGAAPLIQGRHWTGVSQNLTIDALPGPDATTFGVGPGSHCAHTPGVSGGVQFHNPTGTYSRGQPIATACPTWTARKCSRSVTFMGRTFTANRGYPPCSEASNDVTPLTGEYTGNTPNQQDNSFTPTRTPSNGIFQVRVWGNFCFAGGRICRSLKTIDGSTLTSSLVNQLGYAATFRPGANCGPPRWPTTEMEAAGGPPYAEWCDVTVDVRR